MKTELIFIGTSGAIQVPSFHCNCSTCKEARSNPKLKRTRASIIISGEEKILIDATPDIEHQLERENIHDIDRVFLTHWHYDHCFGLAAFPELLSHGTWKKKKMDLYLPQQDLGYFERDFAWMKPRFILHPLVPGDIIDLPGVKMEIIKTTHTLDSIGYIISAASKKFAYLGDGIIPPEDTVIKLKNNNLDFIIMEATLDELILPKGVKWQNFSLKESISFWQSLNIAKCFLTHLSCHSWNIDKLIAGIKSYERKNLEIEYPGLTFAYDGLKIIL